MLLFEAATGPITAPVDVQATAATSVVGALPYESSAPATSALPSLSRSESLAAERSWIEEDEEEEPPAEPPAKRRRSPWTWPLIALILLLLFVIGAILLQQLGVFSQKPAPSTSSVSTPASSAAVTSSSPSPTATTETTLSTPPPTTAAPITVTLFPDHYKGRPYSDVQAELINQGMQVTGSPVADSSPKNTVLGIDPSGPVPVGSNITVTYSKGPDMVQVPAVPSSRTTDASNQALTAAGLVPGSQSSAPSDSVPSGEVISFNPGSGNTVVKGSVVNLVVSSGPSPAPKQSP
jgi:serine/threonine-protein kinase